MFLLVCLVCCLVCIDAYSYSTQSYSQLASKLELLATTYPNYVQLTTTQAKYGTAQFATGSCGASRCVQHLVTVTNFGGNYSEDKEKRPQVFFSGGVHGDERVGQLATTEWIQFMMDNKDSNPWIQRLLDTRVVVMTPMTNPQGYYANVREEAGVDVNRDFPIDGVSNCLRSKSAQGLNAIFKNHMFQLAVTFHAGTEMVAGEWGTITSINLNKFKSPDDTGQVMLASALSAYAGKFGTTGLYPHGRMDDLIYGVRGGMEDWAYAASWPNNGHPESKCTGHVAESTYGTDQLRAVNILVETSNSDNPSTKLGSSEGVFDPTGPGQGHVTRNIRLMLAVIDLVQPYVHVVNVDTSRPGAPTVSYDVGGAIYVDSTYVEYQVRTKAGKVMTRKSKAAKGNTRWGGGKPGAFNKDLVRKGADVTLDSSTLDRQVHPYVGQWTGRLSIPRGAKLLRFRAMANVDKVMVQNAGAWPSLPPQSHWVNARTNPAWHARNTNTDAVELGVDGSKTWSSPYTCFDDAGEVAACA